MLKDRGERPDGSFKPTFELSMQYGIPRSAKIAWNVDNGTEAYGADSGRETFSPHFPDDKPHEIEVMVGWIENGRKKQASVSVNWDPKPDPAIVNYDIVRVGREYKANETVYLYAVKSSPEGGQSFVRSWSIVRESSGETKTIKADTEKIGRNLYLRLHGKDIAGEANLTLTAIVQLGKDDKKTREVEKIFHFAYDDISKSKTISDEDVEKLAAAGKGIVPSVYRVVTDRGMGTAFAISENRLLTNAHVVDDMLFGGEVALYQANTPNRIGGKVLFVDPSSDLALLEVKGAKLAPIPQASSIESGEPVVSVGFPFSSRAAEKMPEGGYKPSISTGTIKGFEDLDGQENAGGQYRGSIMVSDASSNPGSSGSPVVNQRGELVGVHRMGFHTVKESGETKTSGIIPLSTIRSFVSRHAK